MEGRGTVRPRGDSETFAARGGQSLSDQTQRPADSSLRYPSLCFSAPFAVRPLMAASSRTECSLPGGVTRRQAQQRPDTSAATETQPPVLHAPSSPCRNRKAPLAPGSQPLALDLAAKYPSEAAAHARHMVARH
ncbi:hypothetical protein JDV02_006381 [Purpureocillium takamizusanense]|uniref:Uncharacterized protein n=1 Tax=Purpureocillium takamizusanense TaxID=2060973 RepID=A0A9Q8QK41_9HYPO|nr:uncharacterized protein JDV02_006381 [Purpureocillium takamizusanense]UNI20281.1 hypothetical protein JDV02_006381 [Purpureocillium takamizusanense]